MTELIDPSLVRNISNSEVTAFLSCKRMYKYAFFNNLAPKVTATPLARGTLGHEAFEFYIRARLDGMTHEQAYKEGQKAFLAAMAHMNVDTVLQTKFLWERYMDFHNGWPEWKLLGTEERYDVKLTDTLNLTMRYDLYVEDVRSGKRLIGDFKFAYDFWSAEDHDLNGQMPKYIAAMQHNGLQVDGGFLEEIRTRPLGADKTKDSKNLWRRTPYYPSIARRKSVLRQHIAAALSIERYRGLPETEREAETIPVLNKHGACKFCNFKDLCNSELEGKTDLTLDIATSYVQNTYGYNNQEPDLKELETLI